jgi:hypothetical protein
MFSKQIFTIAAIASVLTFGMIASTYTQAQSPTPKKAMTWAITKVQAVGGKTYVLVSSDSVTNAYQGDTPITERRSLLCIKKDPQLYPNPGSLVPEPAVTPGGANTNTWSNGKVMIIPNVLGSSLISAADANKKCATVGVLIHGMWGFRMAEFHDGTGNFPGWSYWAEAHSIVEGLNAEPMLIVPNSSDARYWVRINDQPANPW